MTIDKNRFVAEKLGMCRLNVGSLDDEGICTRCGMPCECHHNPDFSTDAGTVQLLRLMMKSKDWPDFCNKIGYRFSIGGTYHKESGYIPTWKELIPIYYITTPGALLDAVAAWFGWEWEEK
jgi:hypothetical protein